MLHTDQISVARHLGSGKIGLEKESLRITKEGFMTQTRDPFVDVPCIVRDFCENQTEINTPVQKTCMTPWNVWTSVQRESGKRRSV